MKQYKTSFNPKSSNAKTGPMPVTRTERLSCPIACPLKDNGCYADLGPTGMHWRKVETNGISWDAMLDKIKALPDGQIWRHNEAGDLPHENEIIDSALLYQLVEANNNKKGFTYTHHNMANHANLDYVSFANNAGFTINLSANNLAHADELMALNIGPVVTIVPLDHPKVSKTPKGHSVVVCPAVTSDDVTCMDCQLCQKVDRKSIVAFPVPCTRKAKAHKVFMMQAARVTGATL